MPKQFFVRKVDEGICKGLVMEYILAMFGGRHVRIILWLPVGVEIFNKSQSPLIGAFVPVLTLKSLI